MGDSMVDGGLVPGMTLSHAEFVSVDGATWWDVTAPLGETVQQNFTMTRGGRIEGHLRFGVGDWILRNFDLRIVSDDGRRTAYATTDNGGEFLTDALLAGTYIVQWNEPIANFAPVTTITVEPGKTASFRSRVLVSMTAEPR